VPDALRVLAGEGRAAVDADDALQVTGPPVSAWRVPAAWSGTRWS